MATENKPKSGKAQNTNKNSKKRKQRYLPYNKPVKKGSYPVRPGVQGFFITCDGGRERQAAREAINVIDSFYEELAHGEDSCLKHEAFPNKPLNKKIKFSYSSEDDDNDDDDSDEDDDDSNVEDDQKEEGKDKHPRDSSADNEILTNKKAEPCRDDGVCFVNQIIENPNENKEDVNSHENQEVKADEPPEKKQRLETDASVCGNVATDKSEPIDKLIEAELKELGDKSKRRFINLDSGCNGVVFVQMGKKDGDPGPKDIVQHMMKSVALTRKHMSRFMLRVLPIEVTCYASEEEITQAIKPLIAQYFPLETPVPYKFAVLYEARANTGIDRMKIINAVAKSVPGPHKVDLNNPDKSIVVQIVKTVCLIGVVEKYKELSKYNLRQLTSRKA